MDWILVFTLVVLFVLVGFFAVEENSKRASLGKAARTAANRPPKLSDKARP
jgi:hypothetical protein